MKNKLELFEMQILLYFIMRAGFIGIVINSLVSTAKNDSYICVILGSIIGYFILLLYIRILNTSPNKNIYENIMSVFGNKIGYIINIILAIILILFSSILYSEITNFISSKYLFYTPINIIALAFIIPIIYLIRYDIRIILRCSVIIFFISITLYFLSIFGLLNQIRFYNLLPFIAGGSSPIIRGTIIYICFVVFPIFTILVIPKRDINNSSYYGKKLINGYIATSVLLVISEAFLIAVLGTNLASLYSYPAYHLLRRIGIGGFIQRIESILAIQWILSIFFMVCFLCYNIMVITNILFKCYYKCFNFIIPLVIMLFSFLRFNGSNFITDISNIVVKNSYLLLLFLFVLPCLIIILQKKKSG